jgi:O-methyltransferase involved in polyketide biosynthesis
VISETALMAAAARATEELGEPWLTLLSTSDMAAMLSAHGFTKVRSVTQRDSVDPTLWNRSDALRPVHMSVLAHAVV